MGLASLLKTWVHTIILLLVRALTFIQSLVWTLPYILLLVLALAFIPLLV